MQNLGVLLQILLPSTLLANHYVKVPSRDRIIILFSFGSWDCLILYNLLTVIRSTLQHHFSFLCLFSDEVTSYIHHTQSTFPYHLK
jgi:hypothetical protein